MKIAEAFGDMYGGPRQWLQIYRLCTPNRYDFAHFDLQANPPLAYHNFETLIAKGSTILSSGEGGENQNDELQSINTKPEPKATVKGEMGGM